MPAELEVRTSQAPTAAVAGKGIQDFDFGSVARNTEFSGIASALVGDYAIQLAAAGPLAPASAGTDGGPVDREKLYDIALEVRYCLA